MRCRQHVWCCSHYCTVHCTPQREDEVCVLKRRNTLQHAATQCGIMMKMAFWNAVTHCYTQIRKCAAHIIFDIAKVSVLGPSEMNLKMVSWNAATCRNTLQKTAIQHAMKMVYGNAAKHCNTLPHTATQRKNEDDVLKCGAQTRERTARQHF